MLRQGGETGAHQRERQARDRRATGTRQTSYSFLSRQRFFFHDRLLKALCCDRELSVVTGNVRPRVVTEFLCRDRAWAGAAEARATEHATPRTTRSCERDRPATLHCVVHCLGHCS